MARIKLGICLPEREPLPRLGSGAIPSPVREGILERLRARSDVEVVEDAHFNECMAWNGQVHCRSRCLSDLDLYFWYAHLRPVPGSYDLQILKTLADSVRVVRDPVRYEIALDKHSAHAALARAGVRVAETLLVDHANVGSVEGIVREWGHAVLKPRRGCFGRGVTFVDGYEQLRDIVEYLHCTAGLDPDGGYLVERFYPNDPAEWASVTMFGGEVMYGYRKRSHKIVTDRHGHHKVYDASCLGGEVDLCPLTDAHVDAARKAQRALGLEIIGFDMIMHEGRPVIVDENTFPGFYPDLFAEAGRDPVAEFCKVIDAAMAASPTRRGGG